MLGKKSRLGSLPIQKARYHILIIFQLHLPPRDARHSTFRHTFVQHLLIQHVHVSSKLDNACYMTLSMTVTINACGQPLYQSLTQLPACAGVSPSYAVSVSAHDLP